MPRKSKYGRPIAYHRSFVGVTGSVNAAVMLSQAIYWSERTDDPDGWFWKTQEQWQEETGVSRYEQEGARKLLCKQGFWTEDRRGVPAKMYFKVDEEALDEAVDVWVDRKEWEEDIEESVNPRRRMRKSSTQERGIPTDQYGEKPHTRMGQISELEWGKAADILYTETTPENTAEMTAEISAENTLTPTAAKDALSQSKPIPKGRKKPDPTDGLARFRATLQLYHVA